MRTRIEWCRTHDSPIADAQWGRVRCHAKLYDWAYGVCLVTPAVVEWGETEWLTENPWVR
jgi:hypothetical protein